MHLGRTGNNLCPVAAVSVYMAVPRCILQVGVWSTSFQGGLGLVKRARVALEGSGVDVAGHSFWIGATTIAAAAGIEDSMIIMLKSCIIIVLVLML